MTTAADQEVAQPLRGLKVIEIGHSVAAPFAAQVLADLGADVLKIENPNGGDDARSWGPPFWYGASAVFQTLNRNKSSRALDLKDEDGLATLRGLIAESDVVIQNMRPGLVEKLGVDADAVCAANPRLIYCSLGAFGNTGPMAADVGYDPLLQAFSGIMSVTGEAERPPVRVGPSIIDMGSGMSSPSGSRAPSQAPDPISSRITSTIRSSTAAAGAESGVASKVAIDIMRSMGLGAMRRI